MPPRMAAARAPSLSENSGRPAWFKCSPSAKSSGRSRSRKVPAGTTETRGMERTEFDEARGNGAVRNGQRRARNFDQNKTRRRACVQAENLPEPEPPIAQQRSGLRDDARHHGALNRGPLDLIETRREAHSPIRPVGRDAPDVLFLAAIAIKKIDAMLPPLAREAYALQWMIHEIVQVVVQRHAFQQAAGEDMKKSAGQVHRLREAEAIGRAQPPHRVIQVGGALVVTVRVLMIRVVVEGEHDRREPGAGGIDIAQQVIPDARRSAARARVPEMQMVSGRGFGRARRKTLRNARIPHHQNFGPDGGPRTIQPVMHQFHLARRRLRRKVSQIPARAKQRALDYDEHQQARQRPANGQAQRSVLFLPSERHDSFSL